MLQHQERNEYSQVQISQGRPRPIFQLIFPLKYIKTIVDFVEYQSVFRFFENDHNPWLKVLDSIWLKKTLTPAKPVENATSQKGL